ncbi:hypothetical protein RHSIM_Rhsim07G0059700 [Rhododendron simsii]|uniref:Rx N-terminal domain-containing protein n=1 Tax=Rhododendron simsii TaxID=118357 RepID=A0A834GP26_RHOSS|nr:hypothetical protein RHSIM_Rhsim07G0059700 [Rhododendron simsii]
MQRTEKNMDAAMVGEALLGAVVGVLVERLASLEFINFFRGRKHDERLLKKLEETMVELNKVLNDAENKQFTDQPVKRWLEEVKDAVYHVEDLVDEIATEDLRSKVEANYPRGKKRLRDNSLFSTVTRFFARGGTKYSKLEEMIGELDQFVRKAKDVLGLREVAGRYWSQTRLPSTSVVDESCVYGRENDKAEIMKLLLCDGENLGKLISLRRLDLNRTSVKEMPVTISRLKDLQQLTAFVVGKCSGSGINGLKELNSLGGEITISGLENVTSNDNALEALKEKKHLEKLKLEWGSTAENSQKERDVLENLEPHTNLKILEITNYGGTRFPNCQMPSLQSLWLRHCPEIESFPKGGLPSGLTNLDIWNFKKLKSLPEQMHILLPSLESLCLSECPEIESFPEGGLPSKLGKLCVGDCKKLIGGRRDWGLQALPSLTFFSLWGESEDVLESFPEEGLLPPTLTNLRIYDLADLKSLNERGLQLLGSLERMQIHDCPLLQSLSVERLPTSLSGLIISRCLLLEPRCRGEEGEDWPKIAHILQLQSLPEEGLPTSLLELFIMYCPLLNPRCHREEGEDWHKIAHVPLICIDDEAFLDPEEVTHF